MSEVGEDEKKFEECMKTNTSCDDTISAKGNDVYDTCIVSSSYLYFATLLLGLFLMLWFILLDLHSSFIFVNQ